MGYTQVLVAIALILCFSWVLFICAEVDREYQMPDPLPPAPCRKTRASLSLEPYSTGEWEAEYAGDIRVQFDTNVLTGKRVMQQTLCSKSQGKVFHPWYGDRSHRTGKAIPVLFGEKDVLRRFPAIRFNGKYLILDGNHWIRDNQPKRIVVDFVDVPPAESYCCPDLASSTFQK